MINIPSIIKKSITMIIIFSCLTCTLTLIAEASETNNYKNVYTDYFEYVENYSEATWSGTTSLKNNTIYYVDKKITIKNTRVLPENSMLVVKSGGGIKIENPGALYIKGHFGIEDGGIVEINRSKLVLNSGSITGINGSLYINTGSELKIYSTIYVYRNGLLSLSGIAQTYKNGNLFYANEIRTYNNGSFSGNREQIQGMNMERLSFNTDVKKDGYMRLYDRNNKITYKIYNQSVIEKICNALSKIKLVSVSESMGLESNYENRYAIRLYDSSGKEYFYFERPETERNGFVYMNGITYIYPETCMNFDEFYYYALGVRSFLKRS